MRDFAHALTRCFVRLCGAGLLLTAVAIGTVAEARTFKIATASPDGSTWMRIMRAGAERAEQETDGRVKFKFYPGGVMGDDVAVLRKIRAGQLHGAALTSGVLTRFYPDIQIYSLPMVFESFAELDFVRARMDRELEQGLADVGYVTFGMAEGGFAYAMSKHPATNLDEARSQKVWIPANDPYSNEVMVAFGLNPVPLSIADVLAGLQTDLIDAVTAPPVATLALQWHTQLKYVLDLPLLYIYGYMAIDKRQFDRLSVADRKVVDGVMRQAFHDINIRNRQDHNSAMAALLDQGLEMLEPTAEERAQWQARADAASRRMVEQGVVTAAGYRRMLELVAEYRARQGATSAAAAAQPDGTDAHATGD